MRVIIINYKTKLRSYPNFFGVSTTTTTTKVSSMWSLQVLIEAGVFSFFI